MTAATMTASQLKELVEVAKATGSARDRRILDAFDSSKPLGHLWPNDMIAAEIKRAHELAAPEAIEDEENAPLVRMLGGKASTPLADLRMKWYSEAACNLAQRREHMEGK